MLQPDGQYLLRGPRGWSCEGKGLIASPHRPPTVSGSCQETTTSTATSFSGRSARNTSAGSLARGLTTGTSRFVDAVPTARGVGLAVGIPPASDASRRPGTRPGTGSTLAWRRGRAPLR